MKLHISENLKSDKLIDLLEQAPAKFTKVNEVTQPTVSKIFKTLKKNSDNGFLTIQDIVANIGSCLGESKQVLRTVLNELETNYAYFYI